LSRISPVPTESFRGKDLGDEYMFYDREGDKLHVLNGTARAIYLLCDGRRSEEQIAALFAEEYELDPPAARRETREIVARLLDLGLVR
jgi:hypothetical protein